jgi:hypothetical protein
MPNRIAGFISVVLSLALLTALLSCASDNAPLQIENSLPLLSASTNMKNGPGWNLRWLMPMRSQMIRDRRRPRCSAGSKAKVNFSFLSIPTANENQV